MSFSFSVPAGDVAGFEQRARDAKAALETQSESNDYALTQLASATADAAVDTAVALVKALAGDDKGTVGTASISGHHSADTTTASTVSVSVNFTRAA